MITNMQLDGVLLRSVQVSTDGNTWSDVVNTNINQLPTLTASETYINFVVV